MEVIKEQPQVGKVKATLLTKDEKEILTSQNNRMFQIRADIGGLEIRKTEMLAMFHQEQETANKFLEILSNKYGKDARFNIHTGKIEYDAKD